MATTFQVAPVATRDGHTADGRVAPPSAGGATPTAASGGATGRHAGQPGQGQPGRLAKTTGALATGVANLRGRMARSSTSRRPLPVATGAGAGRPDWASDLATLAIVVTAGVASWAGWVYLAEAVGWGSWPLPWLGFTFHLSWLLPLSVDVYAFIAARAWLGRGLDADTRVWGRNSAWGALALSMAGNAGGHGVEAGVWTPGWIVVVLVAMVPPVMLFLALHLRTMRTRDREALATREARRMAKEQADRDRTGHTAPATTTAMAPRAATGDLVTTATGAVAKANGSANASTSSGASGASGVAGGDTAERVRAAYDAAVAGGLADQLTATELATQISGQLGVSARTVRRHLAPLRRQAAAGQDEDGGQ